MTIVFRRRPDMFEIRHYLFMLHHSAVNIIFQIIPTFMYTSREFLCQILSCAWALCKQLTNKDGLFYRRQRLNSCMKKLNIETLPRN